MLGYCFVQASVLQPPVSWEVKVVFKNAKSSYLQWMVVQVLCVVVVVVAAMAVAAMAVVVVAVAAVVFIRHCILFKGLRTTQLCQIARKSARARERETAQTFETEQGTGMPPGQRPRGSD